MNAKKNEWVKRTLRDMKADESKNPYDIGIVTIGRNVLYIDTTTNPPLVGAVKGVADLCTAMAMAYAKASGIKIPCYVSSECDNDCDEDWDDDEEEEDDWDDDEEEDDWDDDDEYDDDEYDDDDDWDDEEEEDEDECEPLNNYPIGTVFYNCYDEKCIKISDTSYYNYDDNMVEECYSDEEVVYSVSE